MLYKPTNPSPYNSVIDPSNGISLKASCVNTNEITNLRLMLDDKSFQYYFPIVQDINYIFDNGEIQVNIDKDKSYSGYKVSNSNYERTSISQKIISSILRTPKNYNWQVRLYQNSCNVNIAYGFIQEVFKDTALPSPLYDKSTNCVLKVRPHTNMFFPPSSNEKFNKNIVLKNLLSYYDDNVKYSIEINGYTYPVLAYYYSYDVASDSRELQKDAYDDPLFAYIEIKIDNDMIINNNDEYSIYTNYIDSNEFPFQCRANAELTFKDRFNKVITTFAEGAEPSLDNSLEITYSNFELTGVYSQSNGASVNYYRMVLYQIFDNGNETMLDDTGEIYTSKITYAYDEFLGGNLYKLICQITDTDRKSITKSIYIYPNYAVMVKPQEFNVQYYNDHKSVLLDFNKLISISGREEIQGEHTFDTFITDDEQTVNICDVHTGNSIIYDHIDGSNKDIECSNPLLSIIFKCSAGDNQTIFTLRDNDRRYMLEWHGHYFAYRCILDGTPEWSWLIAYYLPFEDKGFSLSKPVSEDIITDNIVAELQKNGEYYNVPYYSLDNIPTMLLDKDGNEIDTIRIHTESVAHDFWWQVIAKPNYFYIKCINSPNGYEWEYEKR